MRIQDFKLGGALKKIVPSGGRREYFWGISCEKSRFYAKKSYFFQWILDPPLHCWDHLELTGLTRQILCLSQTRTWISIDLCRGLILNIDLRLEVRVISHFIDIVQLPVTV